jgi:glycosyltransferase involved in cell wall biosynthesis
MSSYREGLSRVMLERLTMGKPIITADATGCRERIQGIRNGFIAPPKDAKALADAMPKMYDLTAEVWQNMGKLDR